jgi:hypothetical protein
LSGFVRFVRHWSRRYLLAFSGTEPEAIASLARIFIFNGNGIVDSFQLWKPSVEAFLNQPGRTLVTGMDVARSVGRSYASMAREDWATLAAVVIACGWRKAKVDGVPVCQAPSAQPQLALSDSANAFN